ncbi:MAG: hypothetical protein MI975_27075 [Cytophagales bacterium]|nr:hypothetical protein [Cytophagales bacterium]
MSGGNSKKQLDREFKKLTKNKFLSPDNCTQLRQTRACIFELNKIIKHFEKKFDYIPSSAQLLFNEYNTRQEQMLFEKYKKEYIKK